ncbi:hypothetical protein CASFOL_017903 [Castilleja foliolosa]|uniref:Uncharacterized protein n=1 Tax=Castilleja foliolosa TaxID=1961234 RepID=A0ABD3D949_9LAMI
MVMAPKLENPNNNSGLNSKPPVDEDVISKKIPTSSGPIERRIGQIQFSTSVPSQLEPQLRKLVYCDKPEFGEVSSDEMDENGSNNIHGEEKPEEEEGWIGGMFDFSGEGKIHRMLKLGLSIDEDAGGDDVDMPVLEGVDADADGSKMEEWEDIIDNLVVFLMEPHASTSELLAEKEQTSKGNKRKRMSKSTSGTSTPSKDSVKVLPSGTRG